MRENEQTALLSSKILLVPYYPHHVPTYHGWMRDPELQVATASEPLSLEQEYEMQRSWREDGNKLTFIACLPPPPPPPHDKPAEAIIRGGVDDAPERMVGDVNLFLVPEEENNDENAPDDGDGGGGGTSSGGSGGDPVPTARDDKPIELAGELELMVARAELRGRGLGRSIVLAMLQYIDRVQDRICTAYARERAAADSAGPTCSLNTLLVKINEKNERSIGLFESLGFEKTSLRPNYFGELELRLVWNGPARRSLLESISPEQRIGHDGWLPYSI